MPQYLSPGVYVEEVPSSVKPIMGVGTTTAAFLGAFRGPIDIPIQNPDFDPTKPDPGAPSITVKFPPAVDDAGVKAASDAASDAEKAARDKPGDAALGAAARKARAVAAQAIGDRDVTAKMVAKVAKPGELKLCTSFSDFKRFFGDFSLDKGQNALAHGVYAFFNNGGTRCFVMRVNDATDLQNPESLVPLEAIDEIAMVVAPSIFDEVIQENLISHCENMGDRFAILDSVPDVDQPTRDNIQVIKDGAPHPRNTDYAALYFPWIKVFDIATKISKPDDPANGEIFVGPSGHVAGIFARVDNERGVHKAPANETVRGALGVKYAIGKPVQDGLNPSGINCIRDMNGDIRVWGARTIGGDANLDFKYISVRRLFLFLRKSIDHGTQWVVFEPNDMALWAKIERNVTAFLTVVWHDGALFGNTAADAFYVKCDAETNPPEIRDMGRVVTEIGVAVVKPAEFVIFRISQWAGPKNT